MVVTYGVYFAYMIVIWVTVYDVGCWLVIVVVFGLVLLGVCFGLISVFVIGCVCGWLCLICFEFAFFGVLCLTMVVGLVYYCWLLGA